MRVVENWFREAWQCRQLPGLTCAAFNLVQELLHGQKNCDQSSLKTCHGWVVQFMTHLALETWAAGNGLAGLEGSFFRGRASGKQLTVILIKIWPEHNWALSGQLWSLDWAVKGQHLCWQMLKPHLILFVLAGLWLSYLQAYGKKYCPDKGNSQWPHPGYWEKREIQSKLFILKLQIPLD